VLVGENTSRSLKVISNDADQQARYDFSLVTSNCISILHRF